MPSSRRRLLLLAGVLSLSAVALWALRPAASPAPRAAPEPPRPPSGPRLAVLLVFDQLRGDYPQRWGELFGPGGFRRFTEHGAWFRECHYPYATTLTGAGHATLATGTSPDRHGIVGNNWYDRRTGSNVYCASTPGFRLLPPLPGGGAEAVGESPLRLKAPTVADAFRRAYPGCRVVSLSLKDRGAILPAGGSSLDGSRPAPPPHTACFWFDTRDGRFVTSTFYDGPRPWVDTFNQDRRRFDRWRGTDWDRVAAIDYDRWAGPDDAPGESKRYGRTFPHRLDGKPGVRGASYYDALYASPMGNDLLLDLALAAVDGEELGGRDVPDLLLVSFSSNDAVGHAYGPDSQEVLDCTLRTDRLLRRLFDELDRRVGPDRYVVVLSADHGVCPLPARAAAEGWEAGYVTEAELSRPAEAFLQDRFPGPAAGTALEATDGKGKSYMINESFYLRPQWLRARGVSQERAETELAAWARRRPQVAAAYTRTQLLRGVPTDHLGEAVRRSFHPEASGDVLLVLKPYHIVWEGREGTTHGSPYPYDTHVPLLVYGPSVVPGVRWGPVSPEAASVILCRACGVPPPALASVPEAPAGLFAERRGGERGP